MACIAAGLAGSAYLAGHVYFLLNKALPHDIDIGTWYLYWQAYSADRGQRKRLILAAVLPALLVFGLPLLMLLAPRPRALYGDARWATEQEIREAGLL
jgi:type IV secretion system protein VirD4